MKQQKVILIKNRKDHTMNKLHPLVERIDNHISLYITDIHQEYIVPGDSLDMEVYNYFQLDEAFGIYFDILEPNLSKQEKKKRSEQIDKVVKKVFSTLARDKVLECERDDGHFGTVHKYTLHIEAIDNFLFGFEKELNFVIPNASGDDDIYDYMPNYVNMFRQCCILLGQPERYNMLMKKFPPVDEEYYFNKA